MASRPTRRRALHLLLAAIAGVVAGIAFLSTRRSDESDDTTSHESATADTVASDDAALAGHVGLPPPPPSARPHLPAIVEPSGPVSIEPGPAAIVGTVIGVDGKPAAGSVVSLGRRETQCDPIAIPENLDSQPHRTDAEGRFRFDPMPPRGTHLSVADDPKVYGGPIAARPGAPVTLRLQPRPWVVVTVTDASGRPLVGMDVTTTIPEDGGDGQTARELGVAPKDLARLWWLFEEPHTRGRVPWRDRALYREGTTDANGQARIAPVLREHPCRLRVGQAAWTRVGDQKWHARVVDPWIPKDETLVLRRVRSVEGTVFDLRGQLVTEGEIHWQGVEGSAGTARVEYDGTFMMDFVPDGLVALEFAMPGTPLPPNAGRCTVSAGDADARLIVDLGADLIVHVDGWPRAPGGIVHATRETADAVGGAERASADIDADGNARLRGLRSDGTYALFIAPTIESLQGEGEWRFGRKERVRVGDSPVTMTLSQGAAIEGRLSGAIEAREVESTTLSGWAIVDEHGVVVWSSIGSNGRFALRGLPSGEYTIRVAVQVSGWTKDETPQRSVYDGDSTERTGTKNAVIVTRRMPDDTKMPSPPTR